MAITLVSGPGHYVDDPYDHFVVGADTVPYSKDFARVVIYYKDNKTNYYNGRYHIDDKVIDTFDVEYSDYIKLKNPVNRVNVVGFNIDAGIMLQVVDDKNIVHHIAVDINKDKIAPYVAKAKLANI